jgi:putative Mg2+ transporter-C (MgtC) family protein
MESLGQNISDAPHIYFVIKILTAVLVGFLIGIERQWSHKPAGIRTNILVVLGATVFTVISVELARTHNGDATRIMSNIVTGIGFLGAGAILHARGAIKGLTTAATLWVDGALGMLIGSGRFVETGITTVVVVIILYGLGKLERKVNFRADSLEGEEESTENSLNFLGKK